MSITIEDIPKDIHRELMRSYIDSDKDKISFSTLNKAFMNDAYMKSYRKKMRDDFVINEAMEERIILVYNDTYPNNDVERETLPLEDQPPSFETFRKNWIRDNKEKFMRPPPPRTKPPTFSSNSSKGETSRTPKKTKKSKSKKSTSKTRKKTKKSKSKKRTSNTPKKTKKSKSKKNTSK
tara:strand:+ start:566 stop:1102 length:537 start_codon:yes stop_codon:yes gene_type:complete